MAHVGRLAGLKCLELPAAAITEKGLAHLKSLRALERLLVAGPDVTHAAIVELRKKLPRVEVLEHERATWL